MRVNISILASMQISSNVVIMQRIKSLIEKLNLQFEQKSQPADMLATLQLLMKEITGGLKETEMLGHSNVSVLVPNTPSINYPKFTEPHKNDEKVYFELEGIEVNEEEINELLLQNATKQPVKNEPGEQPENRYKGKAFSKKDTSQTELSFGDEAENAIAEVPTFAQYAKPDVVPDKPKPLIIEENANPVKHLKKAISEQDKLLFLNDLFRGDEVMYERSIKTIDNFHAFAEAEFWIRRELKTKLGWLPDNPTVDHFDRLVKRRFA